MSTQQHLLSSGHLRDCYKKVQKCRYNQALLQPLIACGTVNNVLFEKKETLFPVKTFETTCLLGECSIPTVSFYQTFLLHFCYTQSMPLISKTSPDILLILSGRILICCFQHCFYAFSWFFNFFFTLSIVDFTSAKNIVKFYC